ncbi:ribonuclease II [Ceratobasidium sp. AG-Ba]|nr:ribonuclease II [Ceratobasidium sp. AG-Ba]
MSSLPTRGSRAAKPHQRKPYERPPPSPAPLARSKSSFFNTVKSLVTAPLSWLSGGEGSVPAANGANGEAKQLKRRASKNRVDNGEGSKPKRMRTISPQRVSASGYLDPPEHMLRHTISAATFARSGLKAVFSNGDAPRPSIRDTPLQFNSLSRAKSPSRRTPSLGPWFPQPTSTRNSLAPRPSQVHFGALPNLNIDAAIAAHDDSRMLSPSPSVGHGSGIGLGRERTPNRALPGREPSVSLSRVSVSRATGASMRASISASNPFASLGKSSSAAPERRKSALVWDDTVGVTTADNTEPKGTPTPAPAAKNTAERLLNALENMHTHTGDAQRPRRRPPPSVQVPTPGPSVPSKLKRMIQPYGEVKLSPKAKAKGTQGRPMSGLMKILMKNKKDSEAEEMEVEEPVKATESVKPPAAVSKPVEKVAEKSKEADKPGDVDMDSQPGSAPTTSPALKVIDNFRPASQPPSRPGSSLRQSKTVTKRAHVPSAGRNRFSANNEEDEEDEEAIERRNAELVAVANASVFTVPEGFKFGGSVTPALPTPKPVEPTKSDTAMDVISPKPIPTKSTPTPILSFTPITVPKSGDPPPKPVFFAESAGAKTELPKFENPFAALGGGFGKAEVKVPEVPKWNAPTPTPAPAPAAKPNGEVSVFANIGVPAPSTKPATTEAPKLAPVEAKPTEPSFSFGKAAEPTPAPEKTSEPAKPLFGAASSFSFGKPASPPAPAPVPTLAPSSNPFAGIGVNKSTATASAPSLPFSFGSSKPESAPAPAPTPAFSFGKPAEKVEPVPEAPKPIEAPKPSASPFSFSSTQPTERPAEPSRTPSFSFGAPPTATTPAPAPVAPTFSFGGAPAATPAIVAPTPQPAPSPFSFGATPASTSSPAPAASEPPKKSPFDFSASATSAPAPAEAPKKSPFDFSSTPAPTTSKSLFDFSSAPKPAEKAASPFTFGATPAPTPAPTSAAPEKKNPFDFSSAPKPESTTFTFGSSTPAPAPATNGFTFGPPAPARPSTPPTGGDAAMEESPTREPAKIVTSGFGSGSGFPAQPPSSSFAFGSNTNGANGASTGPFGGPLTAGGTQTNGFGNSAAPASPSPFAFGANNGTPGGFGSNGFNTNGSAAPASTPGFTFGTGGGFGQTTPATASPSNPFNQPAPSNPFGQPTPATTNAFTPASPFPAASPALNPVGFPNTSAPTNAFGASQPATNGFPSSPAPTIQTGFAFGNNAPNTGAASPATFTFGLPASPATPTATSSPFVFGAGAPEQGSPAAGVQFNLGTADASPGGRKIKPLRRPRRN